MLSIRRNVFIDINLWNCFFYLYTMIVHRWMRQVQLKISDFMSEKSKKFFYTLNFSHSNYNRWIFFGCAMCSSQNKLFRYNYSGTIEQDDTSNGIAQSNLFQNIKQKIGRFRWNSWFYKRFYWKRILSKCSALNTIQGKSADLIEFALEIIWCVGCE